MRCPSVLLALVALAGAARADPQVFSDRVLVGVDFLGTRAGYHNYTVDDIASFTQSFDVAGRVGHTRAATVWLGGELALAVNGETTSVEPGAFVLFTFERLFHVPIVPMFRIGLSAAQVLETSEHASNVATDGYLKSVGSLYYFVTPHVGIGFDAALALGLGTRPKTVRIGDVGGFTDLSAGLRFVM